MRHNHAALVAISLALAIANGSNAHAGGRLGDFGRPEPSVITDYLLPWLGSKLAAGRHEPVSQFQLTDREMELRDRAYALFMPGHRVHFFARHRAELVRARVWPDETYRVDPTAYYHALRAQGFISSQTRYNALEQSIRADLGLIEPFMVQAERVYADDRRRLAALAHIEAADPRLGDNAHARIYENRRVVDWAIIAMQWRVEAYTFALETTRVEIPSIRADDVEMALTRLSAAVAIMAESINRLEAIADEGRYVKGGSGPIDLRRPVSKP